MTNVFEKELIDAFSSTNTPSLSLNEKILKKQNRIIKEISKNVTSNHYLEAELRGLKEKSPNIHYPHSLRVGMMYFDLVLQEPELLEQTSRQTHSVAGISHDLAKVLIPEYILEKPEKLLPEERKIIEAHNRMLYCSPIIHFLDQNFYPNLCAIMVRHHKYPRKGTERRQNERRELNLTTELGQRSGKDRRQHERRTYNPALERAGTLLRIADIYDALSSKRGYKPAYISEEVQQNLLTDFPKDLKSILYLAEHYPGP